MLFTEEVSANLSAKYVAISSKKLISDLEANGFHLSGFQTKPLTTMYCFYAYLCSVIKREGN